MAYIGATDGVSDVAVVDVAGHGRVLYQVLGTRDARPIPGVRGQVLDVTFAFTANDPLRSDRAVLVAAGVSADEAGRVGPREFLRFDERVVRGVNTFRYMVEVPDFQVLQGNEPCIPTR